jgi:Tfp pilus assembly protein PilO
MEDYKIIWKCYKMPDLDLINKIKDKLRNRKIKIGIIILIVLIVIGIGYSLYMNHEQSKYDKKLTKAHEYLK